MKYWHLLTLLVTAQLSLAQNIPEHHSKRILVKFADQSMLQSIDIESNRFNIPTLDELNKKNQITEIKAINPGKNAHSFSFEFEKPVEISKTIYSYYDTRLFDYVEPDYKGYGGGEVVPNDGSYSRQWGLHNDGTFNLGPSAKVGADIDIQKAWSLSTGKEETIIAILDSGLKLDHPEFAGRLWTNGVGHHGKDFANNDAIPSDDQGHGTNVTSIIGSNADNNNGFAGVNWKSKLMILKILDSDNSGFYSWWASAIYFATDNGARVLNMSVGGSSYSAVMEDAINYATSQGVIVVACMMNENNDVSYYPAAYDNTIAVGATNPDDTRADQFPWNTNKGSNFGEHIDLSAPGNYIYGLHYNNNTNFNSYWSGTSQATPYVAGVVSLLLALDDDLTLESVRSILTNSAEDQVGRSSEDKLGFDIYHGHGRLNAFEAMSSLSATSTENINVVGFKISPNPIQQGDDLSIEFAVGKERIISIFDTTGQLVAMNKTSDNIYVINSANLATGAYILKVQEKGSPVSSSKFVVEK